MLLLQNMESKKTIYLGMFIGGLIGGYLPSILWGAGTFSFSSLFGNAAGAMMGIYIAFKATRWITPHPTYLTGGIFVSEFVKKVSCYLDIHSPDQI